MSNYSALKTDINNNIYENNTQQITGTVLNTVLKDMVNTLGAGYQFAGCAYLDLNPGAPDAKVFYLAGEGLYTNFDNIQVPAGKLGILKWDTRWHLETIEGLGGGGANLTGYISVASTDNLPEVGEPTIGYLCGTNLYLYVGEGGDTKEGKYQNCGSFRGPEGVGITEIEQVEQSTENGGRNTIRIHLSNGTSYDVYTRNGTTSTGLFPTLADLQAAHPTPVVGQYAFVGAGFPADIYVCQTAGTWTDSGADYDGDNVDLTDYATKDELAQLEHKVDDLFGEIPFDVINGSGINIDGVITSVADGKRSDYIDIDGIDKLYFTNPNNAFQYYNVFYDSSKSKITSFSIAANAKYQEETVPTGAKYLIISVRDSGAMTSVFKNGQIVDTAKNTEGLAQLRTDFNNLSPTRANGILGNFYQNGRNNIVPSSADLNDYKTADIIRTEAGVTNAPNSANGFIVETVVVPWINASRYTAVQKAFVVSDPSIVYLRVYESNSNTWSDWKALPLPSQVAETVKYVSQSLTTSQKTQARTNIGAASSSAETAIAKFVTGEYINEGSINSINTPGGYNIGASVTDCPGAGGGYLFVVASNSRFIQKYFFHTSGLILYYGVIDTNTNSMLIAWTAINKAPLNSTGNSTTDAISQKAATDYVDNPNRPYTTSGSVNDLKKTGGYWVTADVTDRPEGEAAGSVIVTPTFNNGRFIHKKFIAQNGGNIFEQIQDSNNAAVPIMPWTLTNPRANIATFGKNIVCFGDSIFGNYDGTSGNGEGVVSFMHRFGYANTFNCAFGGTTAAIRGYTTHWNDMSFTALVDAIISGDWTAQDYAIEHASYFPAAFAVHLATLKAVDWSTVDIVTVAFGANDFAQNIALGDNTENKNNYTGALLYGISKLMAQYPHLKFVLLSPCWRWYKDASGYYDHDSDTEQNTLNLKLTDYVDANLNLADIIHIPGCDNYHKLGITKYNYTGYFNTGDNADGAHHALYGRKTLAHRIVAFINANC